MFIGSVNHSGVDKPMGTVGNGGWWGRHCLLYCLLDDKVFLCVRVKPRGLSHRWLTGGMEVDLKRTG